MSESAATVPAAPSALRRVRGYVDTRPIFALAIAMAIGMFIGELTKGH